MNISCIKIDSSMLPEDADISVVMGNGYIRHMTVPKRLLNRRNKTVKAKLLYVAKDRFETVRIQVANEEFFIKKDQIIS